MADQIPLTRPDISDDAGRSLVRVQPAEMGQLVWRVEYDQLGPILQINEMIQDWRGIVSGSPLFQATVLPAIMDGILTKILIEDGHDPNPESDEWMDRFVQLAAVSGNRPYTRNDNVDYEAKRDWIEAVVEGFAGRHKIADRLIRSLSE